MKLEIDCEELTNRNNCKVSLNEKKTKRLKKCVFQRNFLSHRHNKVIKNGRLCNLSNTCRKRLISCGKDSEYFFEHICPQIDNKFEEYLTKKISAKEKKRKENSPLIK
jgi:hypothetical protein